MFKYKLINNITNERIAELTLSDDVENPWQDKFDKQGIVLGYALSECSIEKINIDAEIAETQEKQTAIESARLIAKNAKAALNAVKAATTQAELKQATKDLAKVVHAMVKVLNLVDPTEIE